MAKNRLREIEGVKIRWQYFTAPLLILGIVAIWVPFIIFALEFNAGNFDFSKWLSDGLWTSVWICFVFSVPFLILSPLNRRFFGKIVCVLNEDGIHYKDGFVRWNEIVKMEYEIDFPGGHIARYQYCRAIIYTSKEEIVIRHAPLFLLSKVKKQSSDIPTGVSKNSKGTVGFLFVALLLIPFLIPLIA
ncbi:MAG: hypothetical protein E7584_02895 [Ruminococcaceae bacterium]|nr:hypothetical protein [Oscillospiraceae bacterium]